MLASYEAIYDHGRLTWVGEEPSEGRARVIVTVLPDAANGESTKGEPEVPNGARLAAIFQELADAGAAECFGDPLEWQREVRKDRPLPGREEE
ncbi:MAG: hypothetical protein HQL51_08725 [Magnetococcales bacterium]|nr:hypothetical protein [Magnetococcales bacterium]